jgi:hypothetical protein
MPSRDPALAAEEARTGLRHCKKCDLDRPVAVFGLGFSYYICADCRGVAPEGASMEVVHEPSPSPSPSPVVDPTPGPLHASAALLQRMRSTMGVADDAQVDLATFLAEYAVVGEAADKRWLMEVCLPREDGGPLNLRLVHEYIVSLFKERDEILATVAARSAPAELNPREIPLEVAAEALYLACYPEVRERFDAACEITGQPLNRVMLGRFAYDLDSLHASDPTLVPDVSPVEQFGRPAAMMRSAVRAVPGRMMNEAGDFVRQCNVCEIVFKPHKDKPQQAFCGNSCGDLHHRLQGWWFNVVRGRTDDKEHTLPAPHPREYADLWDNRERSAAAERYIAAKAKEFEEAALTRVHGLRGVA